MAWYTRVYHEWYSDDETLLRVNFKKTTTGTAFEMDGQPDPFVLFLPALSDKFEPVRATGATMNMLSSTNMQWSNPPVQGAEIAPALIGDDPKEWLVEYLEDGIVKWFGYLERKMFSEPYNESENYPITLYAQDGFNLLDRIRFTDANGARYRGHRTQWEVIQIILGKWGLMDQVGGVHVGLSTYSMQAWYVNGLYNQMLEGVHVNMDNYYDEDGKPMTCRHVLDTILRPYGAVMERKEKDIYIYDMNVLAGGGADKGTGRDQIGWTTSYDNSFAVSGSGLAAPVWTDIYALGIYNKSGTFSVSPNYKGLTINYSKYRDAGVAAQFDNYISGSTYLTSSSPWVHDTTGEDEYWYSYVNSHSEWLFQEAPISSAKARVLGLKESSSNPPEYMIQVTNPNFNTWYDSTFIYDSGSVATASFSWDTPTHGPYIVGTNDHYLRIMGSVRARSRTDPYNNETGEIPDPAFPGATGWDAFRIGVRVWVGTKEFSYEDAKWVPDAGRYFPYFFGGSKSANASLDNWLPIGNLRVCSSGMLGYPINSVPPVSPGGYYSDQPSIEDEGLLLALDESIRGYVTLSLTPVIQGVSWSDGFLPLNSNKSLDDSFVYCNEYTHAIREVHLKDLTVDVVKKGALSKQEADIEYEANTTSSWTDHFGTIQLNHGTSDTVGSPIDRAGLLKPVLGFSWWDEMKREDQTGRIEQLLCSSIGSNISGSIKKLSLTLGAPSASALFTLTDGSYISGSIFLTTGFELNPTRRSCKYDLTEIRKDDLRLKVESRRAPR